MMKKALMAVALFSALPVLAADYSEKTQYRRQPGRWS